mmetsp:Transcript_24408/g.28692  ORF Transcript_24408/g.28692 Transcript_24408/m.28692 type:complete len:128 (+) Transcript_24408:114-497(+)
MCSPPHQRFTYDMKVPPRDSAGQDDFTTRASKRLAYVECISEQFSYGQDCDQKFSPPRKKDQQDDATVAEQLAVASMHSARYAPIEDVAPAGAKGLFSSELRSSEIQSIKRARSRSFSSHNISSSAN